MESLPGKFCDVPCHAGAGIECCATTGFLFARRLACRYLVRKGIEMFCPKCGNELPETAAFCNACGATIEKRPSATADAKSTAASINAGAKKPGAGLNPKLIGAIAVVVVIVVAFVVGIGSCSSNTGGNASTTSMSQSSVTSGGNTGGSSKRSSSQPERQRHDVLAVGGNVGRHLHQERFEDVHAQLRLR